MVSVFWVFFAITAFCGALPNFAISLPMTGCNLATHRAAWGHMCPACLWLDWDQPRGCRHLGWSFCGGSSS